MRFPEESSARRPTMTVDPDPSVLSTYPSAMRFAWPGAGRGARGALHRPDHLQCQGAGPMVPVPAVDASAGVRTTGDPTATVTRRRCHHGAPPRSRPQVRMGMTGTPLVRANSPAPPWSGPAACGSWRPVRNRWVGRGSDHDTGQFAVDGEAG